MRKLAADSSDSMLYLAKKLVHLSHFLQQASLGSAPTARYLWVCTRGECTPGRSSDAPTPLPAGFRLVCRAPVVGPPTCGVDR